MSDGLIQFKVDAEAVQKQLSEKSDRVIAALEEKLGAVTEALQAKIVGEKLSGDPIKSHTGKLAGSVRTVPVENTGSMLTAGVEAGGGPAFYGKFLEYGTGPHVIVPVDKKVLAFIADGKNVFAKIVHHPGTPAYHFMEGTLEESKPEIMEALKSAVREALKS